MYLQHHNDFVDAFCFRIATVEFQTMHVESSLLVRHLETEVRFGSNCFH